MGVAAKQGDRVTPTDVHLIVTPPPGSVTTPVSHPFDGILDGDLSADVRIQRRAAATVGSTATNTPVHVPIGGTFATPPKNRAQILQGSTTVFINRKAAARSGDPALTCNDPTDAPVGTVQAQGTVTIGG
jgi:uncharacterized Zn-binding protein involved in type VI secretion